MLISYIFCALPIIFLIISLLIWYKYGKDNRVTEINGTYPPEGLNSLEVGALYKGRASGNDVVSLLIYLANKGYLQISKTTGTGVFSRRNDFKITKLKEYDGHDENERIFLSGLFANTNIAEMDPAKVQEMAERSRLNAGVVNINDILVDAAINQSTNASTTLESLFARFYIFAERITRNINTKANRNKIFEKTPLGAKLVMVIMIIVIYCTMFTLPLVGRGEIGAQIVSGMLFVGVGFALIMIASLVNASTELKTFLFFFGLIIAVVPIVGIALPVLSKDLFCLAGYTISFISVLGIGICTACLPKRSPYGSEMLGKIRGFKNTLIKMDENDLNATLMQNPTYFYDMLPYAYVLGFYNIWLKKLETTAVQKPNWYDAPNMDGASLASSIKELMELANNSLLYNPMQNRN